MGGLLWIRTGKRPRQRSSGSRRFIRDHSCDADHSESAVERVGARESRVTAQYRALPSGTRRRGGPLSAAGLSCANASDRRAPRDYSPVRAAAAAMSKSPALIACPASSSTTALDRRERSRAMPPFPDLPRREQKRRRFQAKLVW